MDPTRENKVFQFISPVDHIERSERVRPCHASVAARTQKKKDLLLLHKERRFPIFSIGNH